MAGESREADPEVMRIKERIDTLIKQKLAERKICYLAQLGTQLGDDRLRLEKLTGSKLAQFVRDNFAYEIRSGGQHKNVLFIGDPGTPVRESPVAPPRYVPRFWAAFAVPLRENEDQFIDLETFEFGPKDALVVQGRNARPIAPEYVAPPEATGSAPETAERIARWLDAQGLDGERFRMRPRESRSGGESLLDQILSVLDRDQLRRINLPLDVIKSLADRRA